MRPDAVTSIGAVAFQETTAGLVNTDWSSTPPPSAFPILCAVVAGCNNSLASTYYNVIWGTRAPVLAAPLLKGTSWAKHRRRPGRRGEHVRLRRHRARRGARRSPTASERRRCAPRSRRPARSAIRTGAASGPSGGCTASARSRSSFQHTGGGAAVATSVLVNTNQTAKAPPPDGRYFPLVRGAKARYSWTNTKHLKKPSRAGGDHGSRRERLRALLGQAPVRADSRRRGVRLHLSRRRDDEHLGDDEVGIVDAVPGTRTAQPARRSAGGTSRRRST